MSRKAIKKRKRTTFAAKRFAFINDTVVPMSKKEMAAFVKAKGRMLNVDDGVATLHGRVSLHADGVGPNAISMPLYLFELLFQSRAVLRRDERYLRSQGLNDLAHGAYEMSHRITAVLGKDNQPEEQVLAEIEARGLKEMLAVAS